MKSFALLALVGCGSTSLGDADGVALVVFAESRRVWVALDDCAEVDDSLFGVVNGTAMPVKTTGSSSTGTAESWDPVSGSSGEYATRSCEFATLAIPSTIVTERAPETVFEIGDDSATFVAVYPDVYTPPALQLASTEVVDGRLVARFTTPPHALVVQVNAGGFTSRVASDGLSLTFPPPSEIQRDRAYTLALHQTVEATACNGFSLCKPATSSFVVPIDPELVALAAMQ